MEAQSFLQGLGPWLLALLPGGLWCVWFLWAVNWDRLGAALRAGAWAPVLLLILIGAGVWSRLLPSECTCLGVVTIPNFWWQLGSVASLAAVALFCGWLQTTFHWAPAEIDLEPPASAHHGHGHDDAHGHGHHEAHASGHDSAHHGHGHHDHEQHDHGHHSHGHH